MREKRPTEKAVVVVGNKAYISREKATSRLLSSARSANRLAVVAPPPEPALPREPGTAQQPFRAFLLPSCRARAPQSTIRPTRIGREAVGPNVVWLIAAGRCCRHSVPQRVLSETDSSLLLLRRVGAGRNGYGCCENKRPTSNGGRPTRDSRQPNY